MGWDVGYTRRAMANIDRRTFCTELVLATLAACTRSQGLTTMNHDANVVAHDVNTRDVTDGSLDAARFVIRFAPGRGDAFYTEEALRTRLATLTSADFVIELRADAIARYRTEAAPSQRLVWVLTPEAAERLRAEAGAHRRFGPPTGRLEQDLDMAVFLVEFDGARLFAGTTWPRIGAAAIRVPVMHPEDAPAPGALLLGSMQGAWYMGGQGPSAIDRPELRQYFAARGVFDEVARLQA